MQPHTLPPHTQNLSITHIRHQDGSFVRNDEATLTLDYKPAFIAHIKFPLGGGYSSQLDKYIMTDSRPLPVG